MNFLYPFFISFFLVFLSELGDKTQLLVLSFSSKLKSYSILIGVCLGSFLSHGVAILFGSAIGNLNNPFFHMVLHFITYISFLFFGLVTIFKKDISTDSTNGEKGLLRFISNLSIGYILMIAFSIAFGEVGDKTFLASVGLGINYPNSKLFLILGAVLGMVISDGIAILFGRCLNRIFSPKTMNLLSGILFLAFGIFGFISFFAKLLAFYPF